MMRLRIRRIGTALHPSEVLVVASTADGHDEQVVVDQSSLDGDQLEIGWPVSERSGKYLVELPRESVSGAWRVWVRKEDVVHDRIEAVA